MENVPAEGGALMVANHSGTVPIDALMTQVAVLDHHPARRHLRMLAADLVFRLPVHRERSPARSGHTLACNPDAERLLRRRRAASASSPRASRASASPSPSGTAAALRPRRLRLGSPAHRRPDHAGAPSSAPRRLPDDRGPQAAGPAAGPAVLPDHADVPAAGPLGLVPLPSKWLIAFGEPIETAATARGPPRTRCWCSTSPTRCARRSSNALPLLLQRKSVFS